ncbi:MAG: hypothetical protein Q8P41_01740 [Pseudomonadota bacterium]|nr:hypothetical protein [Pseudomonadota bacterium]
MPAPPHAADAVHALLGTWAFVAAAIGLDVGLWALCAVTVSAALRAMGVSGLEHLLPKRPTWSLLLRPCGVATRRFYVAPTDRARVVPRLPFVALGALAIALLALAGGLLPRALGAAAVVGVGLYSMWLNRPTRVEPDGPEVEAARALLRLAEQEHDPTVAVALVGGASARGDGIVALLDWWALRPEEVEVCLVVPKGSPAADAAATLTRAGWRVRTLSPDALRSPP